MTSEIFYHLLVDTRGKDLKYLHLLYFPKSGHFYAQKCVVACRCQDFVSNSPPTISAASVDFESSFSSVNIISFFLLTLHLWNYTNGPVLYSTHQSCKNYWWSSGTVAITRIFYGSTVAMTAAWALWITLNFHYMCSSSLLYCVSSCSVQSLTFCYFFICWHSPMISGDATMRSD